MSLNWALILGMFIAVVSAVTITAIAEKYGERSKFLKFIRDFLDCKIMAAEIIIKSIYIVSSFALFVTGIVFLSFWNVYPELRLWGICLLSIGVLGKRVVYELLMTFLRRSKKDEDIKYGIKEREDNK